MVNAERDRVSVTVDRGPLMNVWRGRVDTEPHSERWHQIVQPLKSDSEPGLAVIGFASDVGVKRNQGRIGAQGGPEVLRKVLGNLPVHHSSPLYEVGDVECLNEDLGGAQKRLAHTIARTLQYGHFPVVLGGGHEVAFGSWQGLAQFIDDLDGASTSPRIGIINFDAHFDLRSFEAQASSGTPFTQIAAQCAERGWPFQYACLGVSRAANTRVLFERAAELGVWVREDHAMVVTQLPEITQQLDAFVAQCDHLYLTIDLDAFPASVAPGVSAPAPRGIGLDVVESLIGRIRDSGKLRLLDVAELNPHFDVDYHTARLAARLIHWATLNQ
ncbi:formimidoylglutamase [Salinispirillum sp. LH 10-3-1]|uniref:Formimidoylglutamase n=1 Tax=Salinispirillum sp. LH 10-3-1 TaxID=2952525 RepID=A0AB38YGU9_9GAMM